MPALSYTYVGPEQPVFDLRRTPSNVGVIPETFRTMPGVLRSLHPTHSVCASGPLAGELAAGHELDVTPVGPHSPFRKLAEAGGSILFLGCGLRPNTSMHGVEELVKPPYLFGGVCRLTVVAGDGSSRTAAYRMHGFGGWVQRYDRCMDLDGAAWIVTGRVLRAVFHLMPAAELRRRAERKLREDPLFFVDRATDRVTDPASDRGAGA